MTSLSRVMSAGPTHCYGGPHGDDSVSSRSRGRHRRKWADECVTSLFGLLAFAK